MKFEALFQMEWVILEFVILGFAFWELYALRRDKRRARALEETAQGEQPVREGPTPPST
jgi:hypothetical protein